MSEPKFTKGPWEAHEGLDYISVKPVDLEAPPDIAENICGWSAEEALANARLIAAAPELYRMTELLERSVVYEIKKSESEGDDEGARMKSFTLAEVRAVLAKARGEG